MYVSSSKFTTQFRPRRSPRHHTKVRKYSAQLHSVVLNKSHHTAIMAQAGLDSYVNHTVSVVTADGRIIVGTLKGCDQTVNLILENSHERVYSSSSGVEKVPLGLYIIRGDNIAVVGEVDEEMEHEMRFSDIKAEPLNPVVH